MSRAPTLHRELIEQARHLANRRPQQPRQGDLRRAVSAAYYSLFHFLIDEACRYLLGSSPDDRKLRTILARTFRHTEMAQASTWFKGKQVPFPSAVAEYRDHVPAELKTIAEVFSDLQGSRHRADYDLGENFSPEDVKTLIDRVESAVKGWKAIRKEPAARLFLLSLLISERIKSIK